MTGKPPMQQAHDGVLGPAASPAFEARSSAKDCVFGSLAVLHTATHHPLTV